MQTFLNLFQFYLINQTFLAVLLLITINNIWRKVDIKIPLQIIQYVLITYGFLSLIDLFIYQPLTPDDEIYNRKFSSASNEYLMGILFFEGKPSFLYKSGLNKKLLQ